MLADIAVDRGTVTSSRFGYDPSDVSTYNNKYRNPVLSHLTGERLTVIYSHRGIDGVVEELQKLRRQGVI